MTAEIELRARVTSDQFEALKGELARSGDVKLQLRSFIDYSTFLEGIGERKLDVRVRVTNGAPEIAVKRGEFGAVVREEALARIEPADLENVLSVMALLGYVKGVAGGRRIYRGRIGDVELALQEVLDFSNPKIVGERFIEAEFVSDAPDHEAAEKALRSFLATRNISPFAIKDWNAYVKELNEKWNGVYVHGETAPGLIRALGS